MDRHNLFFQSEPKKNTKTPRVWNIKATKGKLDSHCICTHVLFLPAVLGCDTTSYLHVSGKGSSLKKLKSDRHFREQVEVFNKKSASPYWGSTRFLALPATTTQFLSSLANSLPGYQAIVVNNKSAHGAQRYHLPGCTYMFTALRGLIISKKVLGII